MLTKNRYILEESMGFLTSRAHSIFNRMLLKNFKEVDHPITTEQYGILVRLWDSDGKSQQNICDSTGKDKPSITRIIDNLEKSGFVKRECCPNDRRKNLIYLTDKGKELMDLSTEIGLRTLDELLTGIPQDQIELTKSVLRQVINTGNKLL